MKKIGAGWQTVVYAISPDRVLKQKASWIRQFLTILFLDGPRSILKGEIGRVNRDYEHSLKGLVQILLYPNLDQSLLGNPVIYLEELSYTQDRVLPVHKEFKKYTDEQAKEYFLQYIELVKYLWSFGIHEKVFNFDLNTGYTKEGRLILTDLGELCFDPELVKKDIQRQIWIYRYAYFKMEKSSIKAIYLDLMSKELTQEVLNKTWRSAIQS